MSTPSGDPTFKVERHGQDVTVPLGEHRLLDESAVRGIRESLMSLAANQVGGVLTLNLKRVEYLGSAMLETLINMYRKLKASGSRLVLRNLQPQVYEVFQVTKLDELFEIHQETA
jgi:anti-sigma B factor antagonist